MVLLQWLGGWGWGWCRLALLDNALADLEGNGAVLCHAVREGGPPWVRSDVLSGVDGASVGPFMPELFDGSIEEYENAHPLAFGQGYRDVRHKASGDRVDRNGAIERGQRPPGVG